MTKAHNSINNDEGFIGVGTPWFKPEGSDKVYYWGNPVSFKITPSSETIARPSRRVEDAGASLDSRTKVNPTTGEFSTDTFSPVTWALMMMGESAYVEKAAETLTNEAAVAVSDGYHQLAHEDIDASTLVVMNAGAALAAGQYELIAAMGYLRVTDTAIADGTALTVNYQTKAVKYLEIDGQKVTSFKGEFGINGRNEVNGRVCKCVCPNMSMAVNSEFDWFSEEHNTIVAETVLSKGKNGEAPYTIKYYDAE